MFWSKPVSLFPPNRANAQHLPTPMDGREKAVQTGHVHKHHYTFPDSTQSSGPHRAVNMATKETNEEMHNGWRRNVNILSFFLKLGYLSQQRPRLL